jgi:GNAT superfamily N-acetyltransferase
MLKALESRNGLISYAVTSMTDLDLPVLLATIDEAWRADYGDQVRLVFDEAFLRWLMGEPVWVGVLLCTQEGLPVGFELALERTLYCQGRACRAYYASLFTVAAHARRRGLGRWILESINRLVFAERGADLIFSMFHAGHAGSPTVQHTYDHIPDWGVQRFHTSPLWGRRLDAIPPLTVPVRATRVAASPGAPSLMSIADETATPPLLPTIAELNEALRTQYHVAFGLGESFQTQYLHPDTPDAGTFWYEFDRGAHCAISFHLTPLAINARPLGPLGQIHTVYTHQCTPDHLRQALHHLCLFFHQHRCYGATILDQGVVPHDVLHTLHFRPSTDHLIFAVRGLRPAIQPFATVSPPYFLDFS